MPRLTKERAFTAAVMNVYALESFGNLYWRGLVLLFGTVPFCSSCCWFCIDSFGVCILQISNFSTCSNLTLILLWIIMIFLVYYIKNMSREVSFHLFPIVILLNYVLLLWLLISFLCCVLMSWCHNIASRYMMCFPYSNRFKYLIRTPF